MISIITTIFNREDYLSQTVESVLKSTHADWELILVDDCSSDSSYEIARKYAQSDARIKAFRNKENLGDYRNRNKAASYATGKYIKFLDADDVIYPHSLEIMYQAMEAYPEAALGLSYNVIDDLLPYPALATSGDAIKSFLYGHNILGVGPSASIIRRECFEKVGGFTGTQYLGDVELWVSLAGNWPVVKLQPSLVWWRVHEGQQIASERKNYEVAARRYLHKVAVIHDCSDLLSEDEVEYAQDFILHRQTHLFWNTLIRRRDPRNAMILKRASHLSWRRLFFAFRKFKQQEFESQHYHSFI